MPARIVIVHDDPGFASDLTEKLGSDVVWFTNPVEALTALKAARTVSFLITRLQFDDRQPVGLSLARLARAARPDVRVLFTGSPDHRLHAQGLAEFIDKPVRPHHVAMVVEWLAERP